MAPDAYSTENTEVVLWRHHHVTEAFSEHPCNYLRWIVFAVFVLLLRPLIAYTTENTKVLLWRHLFVTEALSEHLSNYCVLFVCVPFQCCCCGCGPWCLQYWKYWDRTQTTLIRNWGLSEHLSNYLHLFFVWLPFLCCRCGPWCLQYWKYWDLTLTTLICNWGLFRAS